MSDRKMTIVVLNALPKEWGNFTSSLYAKNESTPLNELWYPCNIEETILKAKYDVGSKEQSFVVMAKRKGKFGKFDPWRKGKRDMYIV